MEGATQVVQAVAGLLLIAAGVRALTGRVRRLPFPIALVIAGVVGLTVGKTATGG